VRRLDAGTKPVDLVILRRFEFNSDDKKMSTICQDLSDGKTYVFTKGSPESMAAISKMPNGFQ
jgi:magnesium-transporting ATPase (P-type)